ncbi:MAG: hypothetical protein HQK54_00155 [Oligoflexales bacterium]|nr:hypothetical protein [Oligoflexales bacterium]
MKIKNFAHLLTGTLGITLSIILITTCTSTGKVDKTKEAVQATDKDKQVQTEAAVNKDTEIQAIKTEGPASGNIVSPQKEIQETPSTDNTQVRVWFAKENLISIKESAKPDAKELGKLKKGEPILIKNVKGDWAETTSGAYIELKNLSKTPVFVKKEKSEWTR